MPKPRPTQPKSESLKAAEERPIGKAAAHGGARDRKLLNLQEESTHVVGKDRLEAHEQIKRVADEGESGPDQKR